MIWNRDLAFYLKIKQTENNSRSIWNVKTDVGFCLLLLYCLSVWISFFIWWKTIIYTLSLVFIHPWFCHLYFKLSQYIILLLRCFILCLGNKIFTTSILSVKYQKGRNSFYCFYGYPVWNVSMQCVKEFCHIYTSSTGLI